MRGPGFIATEMTADTGVAQTAAITPLRRVGQPEEVANLVVFLASDEASYFVVDAGFTSM